MKKFMVLVAVLVMVFPTLASVSAQDSAVTIESVCLVTDLGRVNDGTFNQFAYEGMVRATEELNLDSNFIETQAQTDYATNIDTCVQEGYDAIVTVGFLIADGTLAAAEANPDTYFIGVDQFVADGPANYVGIQFREDQAGFLVGALAAQVTESNIVAGVYGIDIPPVIKFRLGFEQGVAYIAEKEGKDITTLGVYIDDFVAPDRGASAATQFIGDGADVIFGAGGPTGSGGITKAAQDGVWVIGVDQDEYNTTFGAGETPGAEKIISSALKRVDVGVYDMIKALAEGRMEDFPGGNNYVLSVENGGITFGEKHDAEVDDAFYAELAAIQEQLVSGDLVTGIDLTNLTVVTTATGVEVAAAPEAETTEEAAPAEAETASEETEEEESSDNTLLLIVGAIVVLLVLGGGAYMMMQNNQKKA